jgi:hypothetical protein
MPPPDADHWMYDPPAGIREGIDEECGDDCSRVGKISGRSAALHIEFDDVLGGGLLKPR